MRLDNYLSEAGLAKSRTRAKNLILTGKVSVDGLVVRKASFEIQPGQSVSVNSEEDFSSLGGIKLKNALEKFNISPEGKVCIDIGASNGGFTDVMLRAGAKKVFCVDVGECALPADMLADDRVEVRDRLNARFISFEDIGIRAELITVDVSFISLKLILPALKQFMNEDTALIALIKPQFEVGRALLSKSGVVKNPREAEKAVSEVVAFAASIGLKGLGVVEIPRLFKDKNREYTALFKLRKEE